MADKKIAAFGQERGLPVAQDTAFFQSEEGYLFSYSYLYNVNNIGVSVNVDGATYPKDKFKELKKALKPYKLGIVAYNPKGLIQITAAGITQNARNKGLDQATQALRAELPRLGIAPQQNCQICGQPGCDDKYVDNRICYCVHSACKTEKAAGILAEVEENQMSGSMLLGLPGAIIGAIVGALPALLALTFMNTFIMYLFVLIPMASYWGYSKTRGKLNAAVPFLVSILSLITTGLTVVADYYIWGMRQFTGQSMNVIWARVMSYNRSAFLGDLGMAVLFCLIGIFVSWSYISKNNKHRIKEAQEIMQRSGPQQ